MTDDWQPIIFTGKAIIKTPTQIIEITPDDLEWETESDGDNPMGADILHTGIYCFNGGDITWKVCEYPEGALNGDDIRVKANGAEIIQDFDGYDLAPEPEDAGEPPEDWTSDYTPPKDSDFENDPRLKDF